MKRFCMGLFFCTTVVCVPDKNMLVLSQLWKEVGWRDLLEQLRRARVPATDITGLKKKKIQKLIIHAETS